MNSLRELCIRTVIREGINIYSLSIPESLREEIYLRLTRKVRRYIIGKWIHIFKLILQYWKQNPNPKVFSITSTLPNDEFIRIGSVIDGIDRYSDRFDYWYYDTQRKLYFVPRYIREVHDARSIIPTIRKDDYIIDDSNIDPSLSRFLRSHLPSFSIQGND